jgi:hypothetical protein
VKRFSHHETISLTGNGNARCHVTEPVDPLQRKIKQGFVVDLDRELFRKRLAAQWPQPRSRSTTQDDWH